MYIYIYIHFYLSLMCHCEALHLCVQHSRALATT